MDGNRLEVGHVASGQTRMRIQCDNRPAGRRPPQKRHKQVYSDRAVISSEIGVSSQVAGSGRAIARPLRRSRRAPLLAAKPSAIMRSGGRIRRLARVIGAIGPVLMATGAQAGADSTDAWLPPAAEELEQEDRLAEPAPPRRGSSSVLLRAESGTRGPLRMRRVAVETVRSDGRGGVSFSALNVENVWRPAVSLKSGALGLAAGWLVLRNAPASFAQRIGLALRRGRVPDARAAAGTFEAPVAASASVVDGVGLEVRSGLSSWLLVGRRASDRAAMVVGGVAFDLPLGRGAFAGARCGEEAFGVAAYRVRLSRSACAVEALFAPDGTAWLAAAESRVRPLDLSARWCVTAGGPRPVSGEAAAALRGRTGSARLTWRSWSPTARGDNGAVDLDAATTVLGSDLPVRARLTQRPASEGARGARGAMLDATVARDGGRSLSVLASWRRGTTGRRAGRTLGGRLRIEGAGGGHFELLLEATRAAADGTTPTERLHASGAVTLEERTGSGLAATSRGAVRQGPVTVGYVVYREERVDGARSLTATVWLRLIHPSPPGGGRGAADPLPLR